ncbi:MAG: APC family permease [Cyanobacteriota bacterium]|nr:APC family permease [Cyanobacteriota bacterium]
MGIRQLRRRFSRALLGSPLPTSASHQERLPNAQAMAVLSSDALSSVAYATDQTLAVLVLAGSAALMWSLPITLAVIALVAIVVLSYQQTLRAYPEGGGCYIVARANLGTTTSLVGAAALLIDYSLTAAVSLMAGTQALTSYLPGLLPWQVPIAIALLVFVGWINLRGMSESGRLFSIPVYAFIAMVALLVGFGLVDLVLRHGFVPEPTPPVKAIAPLSLFLVLRAFSSGCSAMTGIEAIANGVKVFRDPSAVNARGTMAVMGLILSLMFLGISLLAWMYGVDPSSSQTSMAMLGERIFGASNPLYPALQLFTLLILMLAANTAFADFPRLGALLATDSHLPRLMAFRGDRLVFQNGILVLIGLAGLIIVFCKGDTTMAINLYAVGVFLAFTLSQTGMVIYWLRERGSAWRWRAVMNGFGALFTALVLAVVVFSKFTSGAWLVVLLIPSLVWFLDAIRQRYVRLQDALELDPSTACSAASDAPSVADAADPSATVLPQDDPGQGPILVCLESLNRAAVAAVRQACSMSRNVRVLFVYSDHHDPARIQADWDRQLGDPLGVPLTLQESPYASFIDPLVEMVHACERQEPDQRLTVMMPEVISPGWLDGLLLNQSVDVVSAALREGGSRIFTRYRYYLQA